MKSYLQKTAFKSIPNSPTIASIDLTRHLLPPVLPRAAIGADPVPADEPDEPDEPYHFFLRIHSPNSARASAYSASYPSLIRLVRAVKRLPQFQPSVLAGGALAWLRTAPIQTASVPRAHPDNKLLPSLCLYETKTFLTTSSPLFPVHDPGRLSFAYIFHL